jgi:tetratricopeptide (TPR) repeat protein
LCVKNPVGADFCSPGACPGSPAHRRGRTAQRVVLCLSVVLVGARISASAGPGQDTIAAAQETGAQVRQSPSASPQGDPAKASPLERVNRVRADLLSGAPHFQEDVQELKALLALDPKSAEAHLLLGIAYRGLGSPDLAGETVAEFRQALDLNPAFIPPRFYLAQMYLELGRPARARDELNAGLVAVPGNPQFLALLGEAERQLKNPARAVELAQQALHADEAFAQARYYLALGLFDLGRRDEAIQQLEQVVRSGAKAADAYRNLGAMYLEAGRVDEAIETLIQGTRLDPARPDLRIQLARAYRLKGSLAKADEQLVMAGANVPAAQGSPSSEQQQLEFDMNLEQGLLRLQQGRLEAAAKALLRVLAIDPDHGPATRDLAEIYLRQGLYPRALEYATRAEKLGFPLLESRRTLLQQKLRGAPAKVRK